jgi:hypothetical protein
MRSWRVVFGAGNAVGKSYLHKNNVCYHKYSPSPLRCRGGSDDAAAAWTT